MTERIVIVGGGAGGLELACKLGRKLGRDAVTLVEHALAAGVPVVPVGISGTDEIQPIGQLWPKLKPGRITFRFGKPLDFTGRRPGR